MKEELIKALIFFEFQTSGDMINERFSLSSSIEDIAEYLDSYIKRVNVAC